MLINVTLNQLPGNKKQDLEPLLKVKIFLLCNIYYEKIKIILIIIMKFINIIEKQIFNKKIKFLIIKLIFI